MKYLKVLFFTLLSLVMMGCEEMREDVTYQNPIGEMTNIGDPAILKSDDTYYMYATSMPTSGFWVWQSDDLVEWDGGTVAYTHDNQDERWGVGDFWAPEVVEYNGIYYMVFTAQKDNGEMTVSIASSDSPIGPFEDLYVDIFAEEEGSFIDGSIFIDDDEIPYLYYVRDNRDNIINGRHVSQIYGVELSSELTETVGEAKLLLEPTQEWELQNEEVDILEGPFMVKNDNQYYLMYTANAFWDPFYAVGYAVSDNPLGSFEKNEKNPILANDLENGISGPGHNTVTVGLDDETLYMVYHIHTDPDNPSGDRRPAIDRLYFEDGEMKTDGPTSTEQELR